MAGTGSTTVKFWDRESPALIGFQPILEQKANHVHSTMLHSNMQCVCEDEGYMGLILRG
jgi:hypothetical protein